MSAPQEVIGAPGVLVKLGLGEPYQRAFVAATTLGVLAYAFKLPDGAFDDEGQMRPFKGVSQSPNATNAHFLWVPIGAATVVYLFT